MQFQYKPPYYKKLVTTPMWYENLVLLDQTFHNIIMTVTTLHLLIRQTFAAADSYWVCADDIIKHSSTLVDWSLDTGRTEVAYTSSV